MNNIIFDKVKDYESQIILLDVLIKVKTITDANKNLMMLFNWIITKINFNILTFSNFKE